MFHNVVMKTFVLLVALLNLHMHKMGSRGSRHYIFGHHFYSKNARKLRYHVFLISMLENI